MNANPYMSEEEMRKMCAQSGACDDDNGNLDEEEFGEGRDDWMACRELGYCPILGKHSNPTTFDCDRFCPNRKRDDG